MVIDSSAVAAILFKEPERELFLTAIADNVVRLMSTASLLEIGIVAMTRFGTNGIERVQRFIDAFGIDVIPLTRRQVELALDAHQRFGKGRHPARLNMGDCCSYALAQDTGQPLLYKGDDFARTDISSALPA